MMTRSSVVFNSVMVFETTRLGGRGGEGGLEILVGIPGHPILTSSQALSLFVRIHSVYVLSINGQREPERFWSRVGH